MGVRCKSGTIDRILSDNTKSRIVVSGGNGIPGDYVVEYSNLIGIVIFIAPENG